VSAVALAAALAAAVGLLGCGGFVSPFRRKAEVGKDAYGIFVADGADGRGELFALLPGSSDILPVTFTPVTEAHPTLSPDGGVVAYVRSGSAADTLPRELWMMNLLNGAERQVPLPRVLAPLGRVGWRNDGLALYVETARGLYRVAAPPAEPAPHPVDSAERASADSALMVLLGTPAFAEAAACADGRGVCVRAVQGTETLAPRGHDPARWGPDSLAYFQGEELVVRALGPGRPRTTTFAEPPRHPRELTFFAGRD
jgi:hypothetical protein